MEMSQDRPDEKDVVLSEYREALELIHGVRDVTTHIAEGPVRYWSLPASKISADFFCTAEHSQQGWYCLLADAAGHGLASAVFALHTPMLFRESVAHGLSLPAIHERIHRFLLRQRISSYFVSGILVRIHGREIEVVNAGMPDAMLLATDGRLCDAFTSLQLPFGVDLGHGNDSVREQVIPQRYRLARDESAFLLLHTDGLSELGVLSGAAFGQDGVLATAVDGADQLFDRLVDKVCSDSSIIHDDISLALIPVPMIEGAGAGDAQAEDLARDAASDQVKNVAAALRIVENFDRGLLLADDEQRILYVNPAFSAITGYRFEEALGQTPRLLNSGRHDVDFYRGMWHALETTGAWCGEIWNRRKDGTLYLEWLDIRTLTDDDGHITHYLATFTVIKQQQAQEERLRFLALHDPLTGLANRILLTDRGDQAIRRADRGGRSLAVLFIDLDRFKSINDTLGHDIGDEVLTSVTRRLIAVLREDDTLCRFGGDEFVCLLPDIADRRDAGLVAQKLLSSLDQPIDVAGHRFKIAASIGISAYPSDGRNFDDLVVQADQAMMRAKQAGGNLVRFFSAEMAVAAERQLEMEARLDEAIRLNHLELHYQPKLDMKSRRILGAEALVRWRDPKRGLVSPGEFIPVAERSDLIAKIGSWVLRRACGMLAERMSLLPADFHVAINVSPIQFERCDLAGEITRVLDEFGIEPARLQIEVTESLLIRDASGAADVLQRIANLGVGVALDDFGTGYSNLGSLSRLPLDTFKLDQSFVRGVDTDKANASIAKSVWHLADGLGKDVVAEGVETCEECIKLMQLGYRIGQGYRFGKPMPEAVFIEHLTSWNPKRCGCPQVVTFAPSH
jgi:diguanylate cyclase (GGDEF)-like protein/PAS domain S-box-containing protein